VRWFLLLAVVLACQSSTYEPWKPDPSTIDRRIAELCSADRDRELRVTGTIAAAVDSTGSGSDCTTTFSLVDGTATLRVIATGILPSRFSPHMTAVVYGRWDGAVLRADHVMVGAPELPKL